MRKRSKGVTRLDYSTALHTLTPFGHGMAVLIFAAIANCEAPHDFTFIINRDCCPLHSLVSYPPHCVPSNLCILKQVEIQLFQRKNEIRKK